MPRASTRLRASCLLVATAFAWLMSAPSALAESAVRQNTQPAASDPDESALVACAPEPPPVVTPFTSTEPVASVTASHLPVTPRPIPTPTPLSAARPAKRTPRGLLPLFASYAAMQALDVHSTLSAINRGAVEQNGLMAPFVRRPAAFIAFKAGMTAMSILAANRIAHNNRVAAYALMFALNSAYAYVVVHNYRVAGGQ